MDNIYYVTHPNMDKKAIVHAPSTEKARTTFLDWLERSGSISRRDRHGWRRNMIASRMEDGTGVPSDIELWYGYEEASTRLPNPEPLMAEESFIPEEQVFIPEEVPQPEVAPQKQLSPIAQVAFRGFR